MFDLAKRYGLETKIINVAVSKNKDKFPERFSLIFSDKDACNLLINKVSQKI